MTCVMSTTDRLVYMANQIARNFAVSGEDEAVAAMREHMRLYWDPAMRQRIAACLKEDAGAFSDIARRAVTALPNEIAHSASQT